MAEEDAFAWTSESSDSEDSFADIGKEEAKNDTEQKDAANIVSNKENNDDLSMELDSVS